VGGGIVRDGRIQELSDLGEAEIGHIAAAADGPPCWCGGRGCVESVCSGPGMSRLADWMARDDANGWASSALAASAASAGCVTSKQLLESWRAGDPFAGRVVEQAASYLATAIGAAINLTAPEVFVVGGGVGAGNSDYLALVSKKVSPLVVVYFRDRYRIVRCALGEDAVSQGAAILASRI
jgi:glucokinase